MKNVKSDIAKPKIIKNNPAALVNNMPIVIDLFTLIVYSIGINYKYETILMTLNYLIFGDVH